jgi:anti-sigma regulatory factor (Ser/Thr protein kinase)
MAVKQENCLTLTVPADPDWMLVVRMALGGAGALMGLGIDLVDDLRTAADETCDFLLHQPRKVQCINIACSLKNEAVCTVFTCDFNSECQALGEVDLDVTRGILETLIPIVELEEDGACVRTVSLTLPLHAR